MINGNEWLCPAVYPKTCKMNSGLDLKQMSQQVAESGFGLCVSSGVSQLTW